MLKTSMHTTLVTLGRRAKPLACAAQQSRSSRLRLVLPVAMICLGISACAPPPLKPSTQHVARENAPVQPAGDIPPTLTTLPLPPPPRAVPRQETYSVVVNEVPVRDLLFALARDAKINVDVHPSISGNVTMNALNQTLPQLLSRMSKQADLRWEMNGENLSILPDAPFMATYTVDYVNMTRSAATTVNVATQINTTGAGGASGGSGNNNSSTSLTSNTANFFWESLAQNVCSIVVTTRAISRQERSDQQQARERDYENRLNVARQLASAGSGAPQLMQQVTGGAGGAGAAAPTVNCAQTGYNLSQSATGSQAAAAGAANPVISNREAGILMVFATQRQQERVREFIDRVVSSARRQVLIEVTVVEVQLSSLYQQGINWQRLRSGTDGFSLNQQSTGAVAGAAAAPGATAAAANLITPVFGAVGGSGNFQLSFINTASPIGNIAAALSLLGSYGNVKVLSSPKLSVLNNQTAMLKVVDNLVYFNVSGSSTPATATSPAVNSFTTTAQSIAVGFVMTVTPQIDDADQVTINIRPSLSRRIGTATDPNPSLVVYPPVGTAAPTRIVNEVPIIQTREMESILKIPNYQIAVMGGLMQDNFNDGEDSIPGLSRVPGVGELFRNRNEALSKSELVIFLRPIVIKDPSLEGDFQKFRDFLPGQDFFRQPNPLKPEPFDLGRTGAKPAAGQNAAASQ